jgi:cob(I)alamin adenosyltransferase
MEQGLSRLQNFILPGGSSQAALLHFARTVCRRAERRLVALAHLGSVRNELIQYLNRLSDGLFVAARFENVHAGIPDTDWEKKET